ncbi:MAG: class 1 isoprenoid biosynthesis enzyme [Clostridium sp.]|jgi:hypothetical protein|nr:class 1 isoprenoid biosynthesis enzyme [Clostridium sp.]
MAMTIDIKALLKESLDDFTQSSTNPLEDLPKVSLMEKRKHEREARKIIEKLQEKLIPLGLTSGKSLIKQDKVELQEAFMEFITEADKKTIFFEEEFFTYFMDHGYLKSTEDFFILIKEQDPKMPVLNFFQALRNIFIANSLQLLFNHKVELNKGLANYSLLYPYTDNYLDDKTIPSQEKRAFNTRLLSWLEGDFDLAKDENEEKVLQAILAIEKEFPRNEYSLVYESLLHIYDAQVTSLSQESPVKLSPHILLPISFYKGGASVVADACLTKENVTPSMIHFAFVYGTFLQLIDDLQDYKEDRHQNHWTLFSVKNKEEIHDLEISKLISYLASSMDKIVFNTPEEAKLKKIILNACLMMIFSVVGKSPYLVSSKFYKILESISRFRLSFYADLEKSIEHFDLSKVEEKTIEEIDWL